MLKLTDEITKSNIRRIEQMREDQNLRKVDLFDPHAPRDSTTILFEPCSNPIAGTERPPIGMLEQIQLENAHKAQERQT